MHIPPFDNENKPIVDMDDKKVPLNYFNIVKLKKDQSFEYILQDMKLASYQLQVLLMLI